MCTRRGFSDGALARPEKGFASACIILTYELSFSGIIFGNHQKAHHATPA